MPRLAEIDRPIDYKLTLKDIEPITGLKIKAFRENAKYVHTILENGVGFAIPK